MEFRKASRLGAGTPQEVAEFRENAFRAFVSRFYPLPFRVVKGKVHDSFGNGPSASIDCVVVNPAHPNLIDSHGKFQLLLADGVDFVIEVKPDISVQSELHRGLKQAASVKELTRVRGSILRAVGKPAHVVAESMRIPCFIFTEKAQSEILNTVRDMVAWYESNGIPPEKQVDAIAILGFGILRNVKHPDFWPYSWELPSAQRQGWFAEVWDDATLVGLLLCTEFSFHSHATVQEPILRRYLQRVTYGRVQKVLP